MKFVTTLSILGLLSFCAVNAATEEATTLMPTGEFITTGSPAISIKESNQVRLNSIDDAEVYDLDNWEAPGWLLKSFPSYLSGYDFDGKPIWVGEWGKFDVRKIVEAGPESQKVFGKFVDRIALLLRNSTYVPDNPNGEANFIIDFEGLRIEQVSSIPTVNYLLAIAQKHRNLIESGIVSKVVMINANFVTDVLIRFLRPSFGKIFEVVEVYRSNKAQWIPRLLRLFPRDQLPEWYGGTKDHRPILVYG